MKVGVWIYFLAVTTCCFFVAMFGGLYDLVMLRYLGGKPLPEMTSILIRLDWWILAVPVPWLFATALLSRSSMMTSERCFIFAATATVAICFLFGFALVAAILPFVPMITPSA